MGLLKRLWKNLKYIPVRQCDLMEIFSLFIPEMSGVMVILVELKKV
jgi:hypothetical protein